jgi:hypothetical protein
MPDEITLPEAPATVADLLPYLPLPYAYAAQWGLVFDADLAQRLAEVQAETPSQHYANPTLLSDGRYFMGGDLLSEVPTGLYASGFSRLNPSRFDEIAVLPIADGLALFPQPPSL